MTHHQDEHEEAREEEDPLLREQQDKGYGEDEGERDEALEQRNFESL